MYATELAEFVGKRCKPLYFQALSPFGTSSPNPRKPPFIGVSRSSLLPFRLGWVPTPPARPGAATGPILAPYCTF